MNPNTLNSAGAPFLPSWRDLVLVTVAFAIGVVIWAHFFHAYFLGQSDTLSGHLLHVGRDTVAMFPLALLVFAIGLKGAHLLGMARDSWHGLLGSAAVVAIVFALFMVPGVNLHDVSHLITGRIVEGAGPMASAEATEQTHDDHGHEGGLEDKALHGVRDGSVSLVVALPLVLLSVFLLTRRERGIRRRNTKGLGVVTWSEC